LSLYSSICDRGRFRSFPEQFDQCKTVIQPAYGITTTKSGKARFFFAVYRPAVPTKTHAAKAVGGVGLRRRRETAVGQSGYRGGGGTAHPDRRHGAQERVTWSSQTRYAWFCQKVVTCGKLFIR